MAEVIGRMLRRELRENDMPLLLGHEPNWIENIEFIMFSGGISECLYKYEKAGSSPAQYEDIGEVLAQSLRNCGDLAFWSWEKPEETVRATVLGAGTQTTGNQRGYHSC